MNAIQILTSEASIDTVSVTIQALKVGPKQMTLAVFKQLPSGKIFCDGGIVDKELSFWGRVRYSIKDQGDIWVVAEEHGSLLRCRFDRGHYVDFSDIISKQDYLVKIENLCNDLGASVLRQRSRKAQIGEGGAGWWSDFEQSSLEREARELQLKEGQRRTISVGLESLKETVPNIDAAFEELNKLPQLFIAV